VKKIYNLIIIGFLHATCLSVLAESSNVVILNAAAVNQSILEEIRANAEKELRVPVVARNIILETGLDLKSIGIAAKKNKQNLDSCLIVLVLSESPLHSSILSNEQVTVINVSALHSTDSNKFIRRLQRWSIRGTAFLFGVGSDIDPFCVMHDYQTLEQLDKIGMNFSPPWGDKFYKAAKARGMTVRPLYKPRQRPVLPATLPAVPSPASEKLELN
jgi:hypothetical protein